MSDQNEEQRLKTAEVKQMAMARVRELTRKLVGESDWNLLQIILQEIVATFVCEDRKRPSVEDLIKLLKEEIELRYKEDEDSRNILLNGIPSRASVNEWLKKEGWDDAVWSHIKTAGLFTAQRRASLIDALYKRGKDKSDVAAKLWLTMSGDYSEKMDVHTDATMDQFREVQQALFTSKKKSND
jgi:hypothetical protein